MSPRPDPSTVFLVGQHPAVRNLAATLDALAPTGVNLVLAGEPGTGKRALARRVHRARPTPDDPFVVRDLAGMSDRAALDLLYRDDVGSLVGPWRGTLYLEGVETVSFAVQERLAEALASGALGEVTVLAGMRAHRATEVRVARLLPALAHALAQIEVAIPPLRDRPGDVAEVVRHHVASLAGSDPTIRRDVLTDRAIERLARHDWPGNVRQLLGTVDGLLATRRGRILAPDVATALCALPQAPAPPAVEALRVVEHRYILAALRACGGNQSTTARRLGIGRSTLVRMLRILSRQQARAA